MGRFSRTGVTPDKKSRSCRSSIYDEFCLEMDLFSDNQPYPDWVFDFREKHLSKMNFVRNHGIDLDSDSFTVREFVELTKNGYGGDIICKILKS